jgi:L,D-transpeptidase YcbB
MKSQFRAFCLLILVLPGLMTACQNQEPLEMTDEELVKQLGQKETYEKLLTYARTIGVPTEKLAYQEGNTPVLALLEEIGYGHKPRNIKYLAKTYDADSAAIRAAGWSLVKGEELEEALAGLEPQYKAYQLLKQHYQRFTAENKADSAAVVAESLNAYRWIRRQSNGAERLVLVNIRGAYLKGIDGQGTDSLFMRVVAGKKDTPTPQLDTYATQVITYPYWNVPKSIATKEMLPKVKNNLGFLAANKIEVINSKGERVDPADIDWHELSEGDFPYRFRQDTGEDNSLGLLKVDIDNPHAIYLHDTNARSLFAKDQRWRSHGCVRVQHPADLANFLAGKRLLENEFLEDPKENHPPKHHKLDTKVPVFLLYLGADIDENGQLVFYEDVYGWDKPTT